MNEIPSLKNAFLLIENGLISDFGRMSNIPKGKHFEIIDASGRTILPAWCDSHTHTVFTGSRSDEYIDRIKGLSYQEIANKGGGILKSANQIQKISKNDLFEESKKRIYNLIKQGTGCIEIKSGYGLNYNSELKMLNVIKDLKESLPIEIKSTFLGAHAFPKELSKSEYFDLVINKMLPDFAAKSLMDYVDIFCEKNYFTANNTEQLIKEAKKYNIPAKIHVNQFNSIGGIKIAVRNKAVSVDHLEVVEQQDIVELKKGSTMPVLLPGCSFFLGIEYAPAKKLLSNNIPFAIASDFNPGSCPTGNMNFIISLACNKLKLTPEQAINGATLNGAYSMGLSDVSGSITRGKLANLLITKNIESLNELPYYIGDNLIDKVFIRGKEIL
jgi:imidazolonepropionase